MEQSFQSIEKDHVLCSTTKDKRSLSTVVVNSKTICNHVLATLSIFQGNNQSLSYLYLGRICMTFENSVGDMYTKYCFLMPT